MTATFPDDQVEELRALCPEAQRTQEGDVVYFRLPKLKLASRLKPNVTDGLLCPSARDGYATRMFFADRIEGANVDNWKPFHILDQNWHAFSWQGVEATLRLAQMVAEHLRPLLL